MVFMQLPGEKQSREKNGTLSQMGSLVREVLVSWLQASNSVGKVEELELYLGCYKILDF